MIKNGKKPVGIAECPLQQLDEVAVSLCCLGIGFHSEQNKPKAKTQWM